MDFFGYGSSNILDDLFSSFGTNSVIALICAILAVIGGIVLYFTFLSKKNEGKFTGFAGWLYDFLSFKNLFSETLLKILYLVFTCWLTLSAIGTLLFSNYGSIGSHLFTFILTVTVGNIVLRLIYEFLLVVLVICRNTSEINKKMGQLPGNEQHKALPKQVKAATLPQEVGVVFCGNCGTQFYSNESKCPQCGSSR